MKINLADSAGFCFGVDRAVKTVYKLLESGKKVATFGPIVHNPQIVEDLQKCGVVVANSPAEVPQGYTLVIRAHGVARSVMEELAEKKAEIVDATCPFVKKIHTLVSEASKENKILIFFGDKAHPEVIGVIGHSSGESYVVKNDEELQNLLKSHPEITNKSVVAAAQTTFNTKEWDFCLKTLKKLCTNLSVFDTICNATARRQAEAQLIAQKSDIMIVIGGRNSSNTKKLYDISSEYCKTYLIERVDELPETESNCTVGITAGASTPAGIIKEVLDTMTEFNENTEQNFEEMLEESLKSLNTDEKVHGVVVGISPTEVYVEVGRKQAGFIPAGELSNDPTLRPEDLVKIGDEMDLLIMKTNDQEGTIMLSKRRVDAMKGWDEIAEAQEKDEVLTGKVIEVVKGGVVVLKGAMRIFIPASQATASRGDDLNELMGKEVRFRIIEVNRQRRRAVGSIRSVLREERKAAQQGVWDSLEVGQEFTGKVKSLTNFGAFVDLGAVDGMVHISELSWNRVKHPSEIINVGEEVTVFVKSLDKENKKISLGYKRDEDNPWEKLRNAREVGDSCEVKIVGMTPFGAFANVIPGIDGLIHISQIANKRIEKPQDVLKVGETVTAKITEIDYEKHRVSLSIRALIEEDEAAEEAAAAEESASDEVVYVADGTAEVEAVETEVEAEVEAAPAE